MLDAVIRPDAGPDTSVAMLRWSRPGGGADRHVQDAATGRIKAFATKTAKAGRRTEILPTEDWN